MRSRAERRRPRARPAPRTTGPHTGGHTQAANETPRDDAAAFVGQRYAAIYQVVRSIPRGRVLTYGQVAELAGMPGAARAVGAAMRASTPEQGLPWQRVVGKRGPGLGLVRIQDAMGAGIQRVLLEAEGVAFTAGGAISLETYGWNLVDPWPRPRHEPGRGHASPPLERSRRRRR
jgi:methylated-DNA-protein-cysteine methyltransferase-like protein